MNREAPKYSPREKRIAGGLGVPSRSTHGEGHADIADLERTMIGLPGVPGDGMPGKNAQRKLGTTRGSPRRSRTAKASRISRYAVKSRCAREWDGWGRLSDDGSGHYNLDRSEDPLGYVETLHGGAQSNPPGPTQSGANGEVTRRAKDGRKPSDGQRMPGAGLSWTPRWEGPV